MLLTTLVVGLLVHGFAKNAYGDDCGNRACADDLAFILGEDAVTDPIATGGTSSGISISVDGERIIGGKLPGDDNRTSDVNLADVDIQVKFDGLDVARQLNVSTVEERRTFLPNETIRFYGSTNYSRFIERSEVRIYHKSDEGHFILAEPVDVIDMPIGNPNWASKENSENHSKKTHIRDGGYTGWRPDNRQKKSVSRTRFDQPNKQIWMLDDENRLVSRNIGELGEGNHATGEFVYTMRVYDRYGRFDETAPQSIKITEEADRFASANDSRVPGKGTDDALITNIPLTGGTVSVYGGNVPPGYKVQVMGQEVSVDGGQAFVTSQVLPAGDHSVDIRILREGHLEAVHFERDVHIPDSEWFYVGLADLTVGKRFGDDSEVLTPSDPGEYSNVYRKGRLAFYLKGKIRGDYLITAAMDSTEEELDVLFSNLDKKDPRQLLRRLDPDDYYPVYGDDSTTKEDAPTSGRFYVRLERGESHVMWGNFKTNIKGSELASFSRGLYGAKVNLETPATTTFGEPIARVQGFAAQPGTLPQRDEFRGTGGSAYFLKRQDINRGSEQVTLEERDAISGLVMGRRSLQSGADYQFDYAQGVIILNTPLQATTYSGKTVGSSALDGNPQYLVIHYEYTPAFDDVDGYAVGGRAEAWLADRLRIGVTGFQESTGTADQSLVGADVTLRLGKKSSATFDWAKSRGDAHSIDESANGGFIFNSVAGTGAAGKDAEAWRVSADLDLEEITAGNLAGRIGGAFEHRDAGFNAPGRYTSVEERVATAFIEVKPTDYVKLSGRYDNVWREDGNERTEASGEIETRINDKIAVSFGVNHSDVERFDGKVIGTNLSQDDGVGSRTDVGAKLTYKQNESLRTWIFGQKTIAKDDTRKRNDRVGVGIETDLTDKVSAIAEVSSGTTGIGAQASLAYSPTASDKYYIGYRLDPDTTVSGSSQSFDTDYGQVVFGAKRKINDQISTYVENNYDFSGSQRSRTHAYGVTYTPSPEWTVSGAFETGEVYGSASGDLERNAVSGKITHNGERRNASLKLEARFEDGKTNSAFDRTTYLATGQVGLNYDDNWRLLAKADVVISESDQSATLDGDYIEASIGAAYRPIDNDRINALFKYTYLHDLPGAQQVNSQNQALGPKQRSHVLSADVIYDVNEKLSIGAKYGYRTGEVSISRQDSDFTRSTAQLGILRADYHVVKNWDVFAEGRGLWLKEAEQQYYSALVGLYRHFGDNLKLGFGYNFGRFSDDLTDLTYDDKGWFINLVGKF